MLAASVNAADVTQAVHAFDCTFREMEQVAWRLSQECRAELLGHEAALHLEELVWLVKKWMGIQGVQPSLKRIAALALKSLPWTPDAFDPNMAYSADDERDARERVATLVKRMLDGGAGRQDHSLASKVLHWLTPWRIPVYDRFVRDTIGITGQAGYAYGEIVRWEYAVVRRLLSESADWIGDADPRSPLRAIDKFLWWKGGGSSGTAYVTSDPWAAVRHLGLSAK
jgi:hypothetical protein